MVHGILQFTPSIAFRYVLHRCESRDIRCRESCFVKEALSRARARRTGQQGALSSSIFLGTARAGVRYCAGVAPVTGASGRRGARGAPRSGFHEFAGRSVAGYNNDPSAGSPTETLLRLLLPLNDKVQWTSRDVAGSEPPTSPRSEHFTGPFNR